MLSKNEHEIVSPSKKNFLARGSGGHYLVLKGTS